MNLIDVLLVLSAVIAMSSGWRIGILRGLLGFAGLLLGAWLALQTIPIALEAFAMSVGWRILSGISVVVGFAMLGQSAGFTVGNALRSILKWSPIRLVDSILGSAFRLFSWAAIVWLLASAMALLPDRGFIRQVRTSEIVSLLDTYAPSAADRATAALRNVLRDSRFPQVFGNLAPQPTNSVPPADASVIGDPDVEAAKHSVFKVLAHADSCGQLMSGTGFLYAGGRIMTNAHVVAGANSVLVETWDGTRTYRARVVLFDSALDIAVLAVRGVDAPALRFGGEAEIGAQAVVPGFTAGRALSPDAARISDVMVARGHDIYGESRVDREIYVLRARIAAGDSGAPLVDLEGRVLGVVFAADSDGRDSGYALTAQAVRAAARMGKLESRVVATGACTD